MVQENRDLDHGQIPSRSRLEHGSVYRTEECPCIIFQSSVIRTRVLSARQGQAERLGSKILIVQTVSDEYSVIYAMTSGVCCGIEWRERVINLTPSRLGNGLI